MNTPENTHSTPSTPSHQLRASPHPLLRGSVLGVLFAGLASCSTQKMADIAPSDHFDGRKFTNLPMAEPIASVGLWTVLKRQLTEERVGNTPVPPFPMQMLDWKAWAALSADEVHLVRLGHSSVLLKIKGKNWLLDPVFSERTSPVQWLGPKRFHPVPFDLADLPDVEGVIISHDHYDHLDSGTIEQLHPRIKKFVTALGVDKRLQGFGVPAEKIQALDWWQSTHIDGVKVTATPGQHFSGRGLSDRNDTLWASWAIEISMNTTDKSGDKKIYFSGDSGYFSGFKAIGDKFGGFDLTLIETGAYDKMWPGVHMQPEHSLQAHIDVRGKVMMPVHNGTFDLGFHPWKEPFERITAIAKAQNKAITTPMVGQIITVGREPLDTPWWLNAK